MSRTTTADDASISLVALLRHIAVDGDGRPIGQLEDVVMQVRDGDYPLLAGLVVAAPSGPVMAPVGEIISIDRQLVRLATASRNAPRFVRREGEVLLKQDVLGHRLVDLTRGALVKAYDVRLTEAGDGWIATGFDVHKHGWFHFGAHETHPARDWRDFMLLVGKATTPEAGFASRIGRLKPAQIADLIEDASTQEQGLLLAEVHADPDLEAHVFEELDENSQAQLLRTRSDSEVAGVVARMRADDAADAIMDLPQERRRTVLSLVPEPQNTKVMTLLGYHHATAGGLMGPDYLALPEDRTIADALRQLRAATTQQPEAMTTIHSLHGDGRLAGTLSLVRALQLDPSSPLRDVADPHVVAAAPSDDIISVTTRMADFNLLSLPVLDPAGRMLGIVTVDDALEAAIPRDWSRREAARPKIA